jgi:cytochrome c553
MKLLARLLTAACVAVPAMSVVAAEQKPTTATAPAAAPADAKPDVAQGQARYAAVCAACHGADGNSAVPANPKLAGQHPEYMVKQLQEFKTGKRPSPIMQGFASQLSDADMKNISYWASAQKPKAGFARDKDLVRLGERIYRGGIPERQVAACAGCHSPNGAGVPSQFPRVSGQHADYTAAQLAAFRSGARPNSVQMTQVASRLSEQEIKAVSDYIAGLR